MQTSTKRTDLVLNSDDIETLLGFAEAAETGLLRPDGIIYGWSEKFTTSGRGSITVSVDLNEVQLCRALLLKIDRPTTAKFDKAYQELTEQS